MILSYKSNLIFVEKLLIPNKIFVKMEVADMEDIASFVKNKKERLDLKNDYVFKRIFAKPENNKELKELLEAILNIEIEKVEVKNPEITKNYTDEKLGVLDIRAQINEDTIIDIEMQVANEKEW